MPRLSTLTPLLLLAMLFSQAAQAVDNTSHALAKQIITLSGLDQMITNLPAQLQSQFQQRPSEEQSQASDEQVLQAMLASYNPEHAQQLLLDDVVNRSNNQEKQAIIRWLESPPGKRIILAEKASTTPDGLADMLRYLEGLATTPPAQPRLALIQRVEKAADLTELALKSTEIMLTSVFTTLNEAAPASERKSSQELAKLNQEALTELKPALRQSLEQQMLAISLYTYRNISDADLNHYITFLNTPSGRAYVSFSLAIGTIMADLTASTIKQLAANRDRQS